MRLILVQGGTTLYKPYRYVPSQRVRFRNAVSGLKSVIGVARRLWPFWSGMGYRGFEEITGRSI